MADRFSLRTMLVAHLFAQFPNVYLWYAVSFGTGVGVYFYAPVEPGYWPAIACVVAGLSWAGLSVGRPVSLLLAVLVTGYGWAGTHSHRLAAPVLEKRMYGVVTGRVVATDRSASDKVRLTLDQVRIEDLDAFITPLRVRVALHGPGVSPPIGSTIEIVAHLSPPPGPAEPGGFDFQRHAWYLQLGGVGYSRKAATILAPPDTAHLARFRAMISAWINNNMPDRTAGVAVAITSGDRTFLDKQVARSLREANLAHLLAISGLHMGLLAGLVFGGVRVGLLWCPGIDPKRIAGLAAFFAAAFYLLVSGASIATERAFVMTGVVLVAVIFRKRALTLRAVALAVWIILISRPQALFSPGFHMSFAATIALILSFQRVSHTRWFQSAGPVRFVASSVLSACVAGAATAPYAAAHFNMIPHYGVVANVLAVPIMAAVVMPGLIVAIVLEVFHAGWIGFWFMDQGLAMIIVIAETVSSWDGAVSHVKSPPRVFLPCFTVGALILILWKGPPKYVGMLIVTGAMTLWIMSPRPDVLIADNAALVGTMGPDGRVLSREKGSGFSAKVWLENDGDPASQIVAATRTSPLGEFVLPVRKWQDGMTTCGNLPMVVPSYLKQPECDVFDLRRLRRTGSVAGYVIDGELIWISARDVSGRRLWNDRWVRRDALEDRFWLPDRRELPD